MNDKNDDVEAAFKAAVRRLADESESLAIEVSSYFSDALVRDPSISISIKSRERISRRVIDVDRYATPNGFPVLLSMDIVSLCDHIVAYSYIPRYRRRIVEED